MRNLPLLMAIVTVAALGCEKRKPVPDVPVIDPEAPKIEATPVSGPGAKALSKYECNRCHVIEGVEPTTVNMDCRGCHRAIITRTYPEPEEYLAMWDKGLENMRDAPSLVATDDRFDRDWFVQFVTNPHDLRPRLGASMPRMAITETEAAQIADSLGIEPSPEVDFTGDIEAGRKLAEAKGCGSCHVMSRLDGGLKASPIPVEIPADRLTRAMTLAPDLRHTRDRFRLDRLVAWLKDPPAIKADTLMPKIPLTDAEAADLAAFLVAAPLTAVPPAPQTMVTRPAPLDRAVKWPEVQGKLIDEICLHCHSDPKYNSGDGGPGNTGGFGWGGKKLDFSSYERAVYGPQGGDDPLYIYQPTDDGTPKVVAHLLARHREVDGDPHPEMLGMPLGFPPIDEKRIQLLDSWIRQGMPK